MALSYAALIEQSRVPERVDLQDALQGLKFRLSLDDAYAPLETQGYLPCTLNGEDGGLTMRFDAAATYLEKYSELKGTAGQRDVVISLRSGGDPREDICVLMLAAALAQEFGALIHDPKKGAILSSDHLATRARAQFADLD